jgi:Holliday junction DNA helicase RuvB
VLFLDEVHRLPAVVAEHLYTVLEDSTVTVVLGDANNRQPMTIELEPFTVIAATTREGLLPAPLRDRFMQQITLELYSDSDMSTVLNWTAQAQDIALSPEAAKALVPACHGTARHAVALIGACIDTIYSEDVVDKPLITTAVARQTLQRLGFTADGLSTREVKLLRVLAAAPGPVGLATVADLLDEEPETIEDVYEPYLLRAGYLARSPKGRVITPMGKAAVC